MWKCVQSSCTFQGQLELSSTTSGLCSPYQHPSRIPELKLVVAVLSILAFPIIGLRIVSRCIVASRLALDDWVTLLAGVCLASTLTCVVSTTNLGFGLHFWNIDPANSQHIIQLFYAGQMFYVVVLILAKLSIMALFGRLFPDRRFQIFNKLIIAFLICHGLVFFFIIMFQCTPVAGIWNNTIRQHCVDITAVALASAILSIIEDLVILAMPIQQLRNLQLKFKKKLAVGFMLRDNVDAVKWSITEISCALICGSLPALQPVFRKVTGLLTTIRGSRPTAEMMGP
ncbi:hypothetical protein LY78DRAFT_559779, partial [Colletotrichum sublineola]